MLVSASSLVPAAGRQAARRSTDYAWSKDGKKLLVFTNTKKVWRQNTRGDYWVLDVADGPLQKLGAGKPESTLMFAKFSPDGTRVAYVRANDLYVEDLASGAITRLTSDGGPTSINGTSDWVYEEEFDLRDGFRWSPDGRRHRVLALRRERRRRVLPDQRHGHALPGRHDASRTRRPARPTRR